MVVKLNVAFQGKAFAIEGRVNAKKKKRPLGGRRPGVFEEQ